MAKRGSGPDPIGEMTDEYTWTKTTWIPQIPDEYFADEDGLSKELAVERNAADDAHGGSPLASATTLSPTEHAVCERIFRGVLLLNEFLASELGKAVEAARSLAVRPPNIKRVTDQMKLAVDRSMNDSLPRLKQLKNDELYAVKTLRRFRYDNKLRHEAHYPASLDMTWATIFALWAVESLINGALLARVLENGLVGGAVLAGMISAVNILLGLAAGMVGWRNFGHISPVRKAFGAAVALILHSAAIAFNLLVAHFREAAELLLADGNFAFEPGQLREATLNHIAINGIFGLASLEALALLALGLAIHFYAAKKGWDDFFDRYPDYARVDRMADEAIEAHSEAVAASRDAARTAVEAVEASAADEADRARTNLNRIRHLIDLAEERRQEVVNSEDVWVMTGERLLKIYRDTNMHLRVEENYPRYFDTYPNAEAYRERKFGTGATRSGKVEAQERLFERHVTALRGLEKKAEDSVHEHEEALDGIHSAGTACIQNVDQRLGRAIQKNERDGKREIDQEEGFGGFASQTDSEGVGESALSEDDV
jgi:hypothetical protein